MRILTVQFDSSGETYKTLLNTFYRSVREHMPEVKFEALTLECGPREPGMRWGFYANTIKLWAWRDYVRDCDEELILADCDMLMLRSAEHAFDEDFDIAYTQRTGGQKVPLNNGIVMVRPTEAAKRFVQMWAEVNQKMFDDKAFHAKWKGKYPGMNQAAFGYMLEEANHGAKVHAYGTREWNAVEPDWTHIQEDTVFLHFKGALRRKLFSDRFPVGPYADAILLWYESAGAVPELSLKAQKILASGGRRGGRRGHNSKVYRALAKHLREDEGAPGVRRVVY